MSETSSNFLKILFFKVFFCSQHLNALFFPIALFILCVHVCVYLCVYLSEIDDSTRKPLSPSSVEQFNSGQIWTVMKDYIYLPSL